MSRKTIEVDCFQESVEFEAECPECEGTIMKLKQPYPGWKVHCCDCNAEFEVIKNLKEK